MVFGCKFGQPEIQNLKRAAFRDKNICRLDVAMNDSFFVRGIERVGQLNPDFNRAPHRNTALTEQLIEALPFQQLHRDECFRFVLFDRVNGADAGMIQRRCRARFAQKALQRLRVAMRIFGQEFQGHAPPEFCVLGFIHHAHAAAAQFAEDAVMRNGFVEHGSE